MKNLKLLIVLIGLFILNLSFGQTGNVCTDFNDGTQQGWIPIFNTLNISSPNPFDGTNYLEATDLGGLSWVYHNTNTVYPSDWSQFKEGCLCYDYKVIKDDWPDMVIDKNPSIWIYQGSDPFTSTMRAEFVVYADVNENDPWVHICAPIMSSDGISLPSNSEGQWTGISPSGWNTLLLNVSGIAFKTEVGVPGQAGPEFEITGVDNICIQECAIPPSNEGSYCCEGENLVENGNFEFGNMGFSSSYSFAANSSIDPGKYDVKTNAMDFQATVTDHSFCENSVLYPGNDMYMVVNGKTQQQSSNVWVWAQEITGLEPEMKYKFCANFKNMPQCTFDILPSITMIGANNFIANQIINTVSNAPCDWQNVEMTFTATSSSHTVAIYLDETGNGDGNDVAIDDISVTELIDPNLSITVQHQGNPQVITASINTISTTDDVLHGADCEYYWFTAEVLSYPPIVINGSTFAYGNDSGNSVGPSPWDLTTTFPDYTFNQNTLYIIGMYTPECECYDEGFTYQLTYNNLTNVPEMTEAQKEQIIYWILHGYNGPLGTSTDLERNSEELKVYPNPAKDGFTASMLNDTIKSIQIVSISGQTVFTKQLAQGKMEETIDVSTLASGMYFVKVTGENQKQYTAKLLKE